MSNFVYSFIGGKNDPFVGKFDYPIKALIESESNKYEKDKSVLDKLYNVEKSGRFSETIMGQSDFGTFMKKGEGQGAENDNVGKTYDKTIYHISFAKEFTITKEMMDDAKFGMGSNMKNMPRAFVRAYYKTRTKLAELALVNGTGTSMTFNKANVDLSAPDGLSLFNKAHTYKLHTGTQSNYFYGDISTAAKFEEMLGIVANKVRNFKDENKEITGYVPDILIIPGNRPKFEAMAKKVVGSERTVGSDHNDINTQYGNWDIVVLDEWEASYDAFMVMSSDANRNLLGNMFYNRVNLDIRSHIDDSTRNYIWNGYCRFGLGFGAWRHIALFAGDNSVSSAATQLT